MNNNINDLSILIKKALEYYDIQNTKYQHISKLINLPLDREKNIIKFPNINTEFKYEILGLFDSITNVWLWAWMSPDFLYNETNIVRNLLNYGLKINPTLINEISFNKIYLKTQLVNSRFVLEDSVQLELHLAISSYLAKDKFKFIYKKNKYINKEKNKYISIYYLVI